MSMVCVLLVTLQQLRAVHAVKTFLVCYSHASLDCSDKQCCVGGEGVDSTGAVLMGVCTKEWENRDLRFVGKGRK